MTPHHILWDADGVLFHTWTADGAFAWSQTIDADLGLSHAAHESIFTRDFERVLRGQIAMDAYLTPLLARHAPHLSPQAWIDYWLDKDSAINEAVARYMDLYPSSIASNQPAPRAARFTEWFRGRARHVFASSAIGAMKPDPAFYEHIERTLNLEGPALCLIDDMSENIEAAQARGWQGHVFTTLAALDVFMESLA